MGTGVITWSQTAASNGNADSNINWQEGMAASQVNDSARAEMASVAKYRDDQAGSLLTAGTLTAYTVSSNQGFTSLAQMSGQSIRVRWHVVCGASPTLNVDSLGAKPILADGSASDVAPAGFLSAQSIDDLVYDNSIPGFIVTGRAFSALVPIGTIIAYPLASATVNGFVQANGGTISRTTYAPLFSLIGTTYGAGDGVTTFGVPNVTLTLPSPSQWMIRGL